MEYCLGNDLELFSASNGFAVCHDSSVISFVARRYEGLNEG